MRDPRLDRSWQLTCSTTRSARSRARSCSSRARPAARDLIIALLEGAYEREAVPFFQVGDARIRRAWFLGAQREQMDLEVGWALRRLEDIDASLYIVGGDNASEMADVPPSVLEASRLASRAAHGQVPDQEVVLLRFPPRRRPRRRACPPRPSRTSAWTCPRSTTPAWTRPWIPLVELMSRTDRVRIVGPGHRPLLLHQRDPRAEGGRQEQHPRRRGVHRAGAGLGQRDHPLQHALPGGRHHLRAGAVHLQGRQDRRRRRQRAREAAARCSTPTRAPATWASSPWG